MRADRLTILDGAMGTELKARGAVVRDYKSSVWSAMALLGDPDTVRDVHRDYLKAGADVITANNYAVVPRLLVRESLQHRFDELTELACALAQQARIASGRAGALVAGSLPPLDTTYRADLVPPDDELATTYRRIARRLVGRVDLAIAETLTTSREAVAAARAAEEAGLPLLVSWNLRLDAPVLRGGETLADAVAALAGLPVQGFLVNCVPTDLVAPALDALRAATDRPIGAYANSCTSASDQDSLDACDSNVLTPERYADVATGWHASGATLIGGCCDTSPVYIAELVRRLRPR